MQIKTFLSAALAVALGSAQDANSTTGNLTATLSGNQNLTALTSLLGAYPDLVTTLSSLQNVTLFAPSNQAIGALNQSGVLQQAAMMQGFVQNLLQYHVLNGSFYAANITETPAFPHTYLNDTMYSNVTGGQVLECRVEDDNVLIFSGLKSNATVTQADVAFDNGVVHIIDSVLNIPQNVSSVASSANLTALIGALQATNLTDTVDGLGDITIFAPSNDAFQAIGSAAANLTAEQAAGILQYHIINGTVAYSSGLTNATVPTLGGGNVTITVANGTVFVNSARVVNADILVSGGVMHVIDSVLNPNNSMAMGNSSSEEPASAYSGASSGTVVPFTSGVPTPTTTIEVLVTSTTAVAEGYTAAPSSVGENPAGGETGAAGGSSSSAGAAMQTGAVGAAALFGGAALVANW